MNKDKFLILMLWAMIASSNALTNDACNYKLFPVFAGGNKDENMNCIMYDPSNEYFIAGGKTRSSDFAPAENEHGFIYALD